MRNQPTVRPESRAALRAHTVGTKLALVVVASPVESAIGSLVEVHPEPSPLVRVADDKGEDDWMSREHATVRLDGDRVLVKDGTATDNGWKPSANGTFLDGDERFATETRLSVGQVIRTGRTLWMLVKNPSPAAPESSLAGISETVGHVRDELALVVAEVALRMEKKKRVTQSLLVTGARGTGKQVVAREAHRLLALRRGHGVPFIDVPGPALADGTGAADLFGVVEKYATDVKARPGYFEKADGGVLLIDEVADLPLGEQAKLLNVLEERQVTRLGAKTPTPFECLVVAATNRDLDSMVRAGQFRADLLDRLSRFHVSLPALDERREDVLPLTYTLLRRHGHSGRFAWEVALELVQRPWEGNVRELDAFVERLIAHARHGKDQDIDMQAFERAARGLRASRRTEPATPVALEALTQESSVIRGQAPPRDELLRRLEETGWNKTEVGRLYGKHPRQITRWMEYLNIERPGNA